MGVGEPDFITPWNVRDAAIRSLRRGYTQYTGNRGLPELRELISEYLKKSFSVDYPADRIIVTVGASEAIDLAIRATCESGDEVLVPEPSYVSYAPIVSLAGGTPVPVKCSADNDFILTAEMLESAVTEKTKAIILPYPNNPTGAVMTGEQLKQIIPVIKERDLLVISDEIYAELTYAGRHVSVAALDGMAERTVLISGFSKAFAMTGWRVGYVCAPAEILGAMLKIHQYTIMCAPTMSQYAALAALVTGKESGFAAGEEMRDKYDMRRRFVVNAFNEMGLQCSEPSGAFYAFPSVKSLGLTGEQFAEQLLREKQVAVVPGDAFGAAGKEHVRCSYATGMAQLSEAMKRIGEFVASRK